MKLGYVLIVIFAIAAVTNFVAHLFVWGLLWLGALAVVVTISLCGGEPDYLLPEHDDDEEDDYYS